MGQHVRWAVAVRILATRWRPRSALVWLRYLVSPTDRPTADRSLTRSPARPIRLINQSCSQLVSHDVHQRRNATQNDAVSARSWFGWLVMLDYILGCFNVLSRSGNPRSQATVRLPGGRRIRQVKYCLWHSSFSSTRFQFSCSSHECHSILFECLYNCLVECVFCFCCSWSLRAVLDGYMPPSQAGD